MKNRITLVMISLLVLFVNQSIMAENVISEQEKDTLVVLWTSGDPYVAERVVLTYTHAAKTSKWFSEVVLIVWGASAKLISENIKLQEKVKQMQNDGVIIEACVACASSYNIVDDLKKIGFDMKPMGKPLTDYLKSNAKVLTF